MILTLLFFGLIAEEIGNNQETLSLNESVSVNSLKQLLIKKYSSLESLDFRVAVNKELVSDDFVIASDSEIAFLPPFAGG